VPLLQSEAVPPFWDGKKMAKTICPVMDPFFCTRNPPCKGLEANDVPVVDIVNCQLPLTWGSPCGEFALPPPPQLESMNAATTTSKESRKLILRSRRVEDAEWSPSNFRSL